jgi:myosin heavy subunit
MKKSGKNYAIIRVEKLKNFGAIMASAQHCFRERETPNADKTVTNVTVGANSAAAVCQSVEKRLDGAAGRKNSVICLEYLITASHDMGNDYFQQSLDWLKQRHGAENVVSATLHNDEQTRHLSVYVVPIIQQQERTQRKSVSVKGGGREVRDVVIPARKELNAKRFCGGRKVLQQLQTDFAEQVGAKHGLERGVRRGVGSERVTRTTVKQFYATMSEKQSELSAYVDEIATCSTKMREKLAESKSAAAALQQLNADADRLQQLASAVQFERDAAAAAQAEATREKQEYQTLKSSLLNEKSLIQQQQQQLDSDRESLQQQLSAVQSDRQQLDSERVSVDSRAAAVTTAEKQLTERESAVKRRERAVSVVSDSLQQRETAVIERESAVDLRERAVTAAAESIKTQQQQLDETILQRVKTLTADIRAEVAKQKDLFIDAYNALDVELKKTVCKNETVVAAIKTLTKKKSSSLTM